MPSTRKTSHVRSVKPGRQKRVFGISSLSHRRLSNFPAAETFEYGVGGCAMSCSHHQPAWQLSASFLMATHVCRLDISAHAGRIART